MAGKEAGRNEIRTNTLQRKWVPICLTTALVLGWVAATATQAQNPQQAPKTKPGVAAVINGEPITRDQLAQECIRRFGEEVLESEVNKRLITQACQNSGVEITRADIENEIARMATKFGLSVDRWLTMLSDERGISPDQYRRDIIWPTVALRKLAADETKVSREEIKKAYESEYGSSVQVRIIVAPTAEKANALLTQAKANPAQFERLAKDHSSDENSAATRGLIPPIYRHKGDPNIEQAAFALQPGQVSPVVKSAGQFLILKCERHLAAPRLDEAQRKEAVRMLHDKLAEKKLRIIGSKKFKELQSKATIVNVLNDKDKRKAMPGIAATVNGQKVTMKSLGEQCLLRHGETILDGEINRAMLKQALKKRGLSVGKNELQVEITRAAESYGYTDREGKPNVNGWLKKVTNDNGVTVDTYVRDAVWPTAALKTLVGREVKLTENDIKRGFQAHYGERVEVQAIVLSSQRAAFDVFNMARKNPSEKFFGELAHQYSIEAVSKSNFGQVPPIRMYGGQPALEEEAFRLKPGEVSSVLAIGDKFTILRCIGRTDPVVSDISAVRDELVKDLQEKKLRVAMAREFDVLQQQCKVENLMAKTPSPQGPTATPVSYDAPTGPRKPAATPRRAPARK